MYSLSVMLKPASGQCNMHCDYCFYCDEMEQRTQASYGFMSEETLQNVIRKTMLNADREISFSYQGGEPTLRGLAFFEKAVGLQEKYNRKGIRVHNALQTNGYALNEKWCQFFAEHQFLVGLSVDGVQETHDAYRHGKLADDRLFERKNVSGEPEEEIQIAGVDQNVFPAKKEKLAKQKQEDNVDQRPFQVQTECWIGEKDIAQSPGIEMSLNRKKAGTYECALRAADLLTRHNVDFNILTVVNTQTAARIEDIYEDYRRRGWKYQQYIVCLPPLGQAPSDSVYVLSPEEYGDFLIRLFHLWYRDWKKSRQPYIRQFENWIGMLAGYPPEACDHYGTCGIQYVVEADGSVYPCDFYMLDEYWLGNLNESRVAQLDGARQAIRFVERSMALDPACKDCIYYPLCRGGCQRCRERVPGQNTYRNLWCKSYRMFFDACLKEMQEVAASVQTGSRNMIK